MGTRVTSPARLHDSVLEQAAGLRRPVPVSFEFFPPGDAAMEQTLWASVQRLAPLGPRFVSVTYGADGSTRERTHNIVMRILRETTLTPAPHLTCIGASREEILHVARGYWNAGIRHVVALRGGSGSNHLRSASRPPPSHRASESHGCRRTHFLPNG